MERRVERLPGAEVQRDPRLCCGERLRADAGACGPGLGLGLLGSDRPAQVELEVPARAAAAVDEGELEHAELGDAGLEFDGDAARRGLARAEAGVVLDDRRLQRRQRMKGVPIERHEVTRRILRSAARRVRGEPDRAVDGELEGRCRELDARARLEVLRQHADELRCRLGGVALQLDVDAVRVAAANASPRIVRQRRVPGGALGDRDVQVRQDQRHGPASLPGLDQGQEPLPQRRWTQRTAGEEHGVDRQPVAQEGGQVPAHCGVGRVGQADLEQPRPPRAGQFVDRRQREEAVVHDCADLGGGDLGVERGGEQRGAFAGDRDVQRRAGIADGLRGRQHGLLELSRLRQQVAPLPPRQPFVGVGLELALQRVRQCEVDVVAAEQQVVAGRDPLDRRRPAGRARGGGRGTG